jgi:hypothetical protein
VRIRAALDAPNSHEFGYAADPHRPDGQNEELTVKSVLIAPRKYVQGRGVLGEKVGFGIVCQVCLDEDTDVDEMNRIIDFEIAIGLPVTLAEVRLADATREKLQVIGQACEGRDSLCRNHVFPVTCASVLDAIFTADAIGRQRKALSHNQP